MYVGKHIFTYSLIQLEWFVRFIFHVRIASASEELVVFFRFCFLLLVLF